MDIPWEQAVSLLTLGGVYWTAYEQYRTRQLTITRPPPTMTCELDETRAPPGMALLHLHIANFGPAPLFVERLSASRWSGMRLASVQPMEQTDSFGQTDFTGPFPRNFARSLDLRLQSDGTLRRAHHGRFGLTVAARLPRQRRRTIKLTALITWADQPTRPSSLSLSLRI